MNKTKIEWCDSTWNPVTGCLHGCEYCYARRIAERFGGAGETRRDECVGCECEWITEEEGKTHVLDEPIYDVDRGHNAPYPYDFDPTFHRCRLDDPQHWKKPRTIFVCSMADLFGDWVPDSWIDEVFAACEKAPQHRYMFLTKNPGRYLDLARAEKLPMQDNMWYGSTVTGPDDPYFLSFKFNTFLSTEPLMQPFVKRADGYSLFGEPRWIILGAMTGPGSAKHQPKRELVEDIVTAADYAGTSVFMKDSLIPIVGEENMRREFPWDTKEASR